MRILVLFTAIVVLLGCQQSARVSSYPTTSEQTPNSNNPSNPPANNSPSTSNPSTSNPSQPTGDQQTIEVTGFGATEVQARNDALRSAVEEVSGVKIFSNTTVQDFVVLKDVLITDSFGLITSYDIINRNKQPDGTVEVTVRATVSKTVAQQWDEIRVILEQKGNPTVMFCLRETVGGQEMVPPIGEYELVSKFKSMGFTVIDRQMSSEAKQLQQQVYNLDQNLDGITAVASQQGADLLVAGTVEGDFAKEEDIYGTKGYVYNYQVRLKIVRTDTAQIVAAIADSFPTNPTKYSSMVFSRESAGKTGLKEVAKEKYIELMTKDMLKTWIRDVQQGTDMTLVVSNVKFRQKKSITAALEDQSDLISSVQVGHYRNKRLELRVKSKMNSEELGTALEDAGLGLEVVEIKKNTLELRYVGN